MSHHLRNDNVFGKSWHEHHLRNLVSKVGSGITPKGGSAVYETSGIPLIRSQNVLSGRLDMSDVVFISLKQHQKMLSSKLLTNDVLLNITGASIGRSSIFAYKNLEANVNQHVCIIRVKPNLINAFYLCFYLNSEFGQNQINAFQAGGNRQGLNFEQIKSFRLNLPPLLEQVKIAAILSSWDDALENLASLLTAKRKLKRGLMQQLLTGRVRFKEFEARGEAWEVDKLGNHLIKIVGGGTPSRDNPAYWSNGTIPWITVKDLRGKVTNGSKEYITLEGLESSASNLIPANTVIISTRMAVGKSIRCTVPASINQDLKALLPKKSLLSDFLHEVLIFRQSQLEKLGTGSTVKGIALSDVKDLQIPVPPLEEQRKIALVLATLDQEISTLEQERDALERQKRGLMQVLLTGKVRVNVTDSDDVTDTAPLEPQMPAAAPYEAPPVYAASRRR